MMKIKERWMKLRNFQSADFWAMLFARPLTILFLLPIVEKKWATPNRITICAIFTKLLGTAFLFFDKSYSGAATGAVLLNLGLIFDNMDGTVARFKNCATKFGFFFDKVTDAATMVLMFWAIAFRAYGETQELIDLALPLIAVTSVYITAYSKWVSERVMFDMLLTEKFYKNEANDFIAAAQKTPEPALPPQRSLVDWIKWLGRAFFSILYFNEVDIFFWAALALITEKYWIFTRLECGFLSLGLLAGPILFSIKVWKREKEILKIKNSAAILKNRKIGV